MVAPAYRNSQLRQLRACPFAYQRTYLEGDPGLPSPSLQAGSAVHAAIHAAVQRILDGDPILDVHQIAYEVVRGGDAEYADALHVLTRFQEALGVEFDIDPRAVFVFEERLEMPITLPSGDVVTYYGTPDLVERVGRHTARITDWKTHWHPESEEEFLADPQLKRYALLIAHHFPGFTRFELIKRFVRFRDSWHRMVITREELEPVRLALAGEIEAARRIEARGAFPPTPGSWCGLCTHHQTCPVIRRYRARGIDDLSIPDDDAARRLAGDAIALDAFAGRLKEHLKRYLGGEHATGSVAVSGGEYGYAPVEKREIEAEDLARVFAEHGAEPPLDVFHVDLQALDRKLARLPESLAQAIEGVTRRYQTSQCRFRRTPRSEVITSAAAEPPQEELLV